MKKLLIFFFLLLCLSFASSASAVIYKWVDKEGVVNFTDDESRVPSAYRGQVEKVNTAKLEPSAPSPTTAGKATAYVQPGEAATQGPPVAQTLIREGDFAVKLAEGLKIGQAKSEAEAESMLAAIGIAPKNGWIADYPVTPDIIGELQNAISSAVDSDKLGMNREEAVKTFQDLVAEQGLPVKADEGEAPAEPPEEYGESEAVNNYYYTEGPPVVTYYPPPWDYGYLYAWVPYPFWYTGFWFPGFFILSDFHLYHGRNCISNHVIDPRTRASFTVDPATRAAGTAATAATSASGRTGSRGFASPAARTGAASILNRSASSTGLRDPGRTGRPYRGSPNPSAGSVRSYSRSFGSPSGRTFSAPSTGGSGSFRRFHDGSNSRGFQNPSAGSAGSYSRSFDSPSGGSFSAPSVGGSGSSGSSSHDWGYFGGFRSGGGFGGAYGGYGGGHSGGGFGGSYGGGHGGGWGGGGGGGRR
jgi:hypothetical protein